MKIIYSVIAILLAISISSHADVITETVDFGRVAGSQQYYFNQFNTSLGTLTGVELDWTFNSSISSAQITNENTGTVTVNRVGFSSVVDAYVPSVGDSGSFATEAAVNKPPTTPTGGAKTLNHGQSFTMTGITFSSYLTSNSYVSGDTDFNSFKGHGTVPLYLTNNFGATPTVSGSSGSSLSWLTSITGSTTGDLVVTYTYTAAPISPVPEPSSVILGFGGILGMAGISFLRRSKQPAEEAPAA